MFEKNDEHYLIRAIGQNRSVLFLGAGFSASVENRIGTTLPIGKRLGQLLWEFLDYDGDYDGTFLSDMYEAVLASGKKESEISEFLERNLLCDTVPDNYNWLTQIYWHRIYTTNIDNVVEKLYRRSGTHRLDIVSFPNDEPKERDQSLGAIQLVCLHGKLPCKPNEITFSVRQYARRANIIDPLYDQFVRDYATHPTIFIGTQMNEPLFWQYIEARAERPAGISEQRQKSFLISPHISQPKRAQLSKFNVVPVEGTADDFLLWLSTIVPKLPSRIEILQSILPDLAKVIDNTGLSGLNQKALVSFTSAFHHVPVDPIRLNKRSLFLLGATPQWEDILSDLDASRDVTERIEESINEAFEKRDDVELYAVLGSAGSGKSTVLRRLGMNLARSGRVAYLTNSEELPKPSDVVRSLDSFADRSVLLFDNAEIALTILPSLIDALKVADKKPIVVIASRTNEFDRRVARFSKSVNIQEFDVPKLNRGEIEQLISILDRNNLLGHLQGMNRRQRLNEFENRSNKQILIAMREATSGRGFDEILENEFETLVPQEAKILYLCVALATEAGYRIKKEEFVGCSILGPAETLHILERNLRDIVISSGGQNDLLMLRHRRIAECAIAAFAPRPLLKEAYVRLLSVLASGIIGRHWRTRNFSFYRDIVNHLSIYKRFEEDIEQARSIYDALAGQFKRDAQFWLQYGSLELEGGNLAYAENYLDQAESLDPQNSYIQNAKGHLLLRKGVEAATKIEAISLRDSGSDILLENMAKGHLNDPYSYHIYCSQRHKWLHTWVSDLEGQKVELEHLQKILEKAVHDFPRSRQLSDLSEIVEREYLSLAVHH